MIRKMGFFELLVPVLIAGFIGQGSSLVTTVLSLNTRWILLLVLFSYLVLNGKLLQGFSSGLLITLFLYLSWCVLTLFWSELPVLSCAKLGMMIVIPITLASSGFLWVSKFQWQNSLNWLMLLLAVTIFSGVLGRGQASSIITLNDLDAYQGLTGNSNYFGCLLAMIFPLLLWQIYKNWNQGKKQWAWVGVFVLSMLFLIQSYSRASMLIVICELIFFIISVGMKKKLAISGVLILLVVAILSASSLSMSKLIYKNYTNDVLESRRDVWGESYSQALLGGWMGGGFGVTIGDSGFVFNGLNSSGYGREKSNSQLAIIEETGLIGFGFYCLFLSVFLKKTRRVYSKLRGSEKVMFGLVLGSMLGILVQSFFECWWGSPASPEAIFFWMLFGVTGGLTRTFSRNKMRINNN